MEAQPLWHNIEDQPVCFKVFCGVCGDGLEITDLKTNGEALEVSVKPCPIHGNQSYLIDPGKSGEQP